MHHATSVSRLRWSIATPVTITLKQDVPKAIEHQTDSSDTAHTVAATLPQLV